MAKVKELAARIELLEALLKRAGIEQPVEALPPTERPDYIPHGSPRHAQLLGLVEVVKDDPTITLATYASPRTERVFRLEDELGAIQFYPNIDPEKAVRLVLQQRVGELETTPTVPEDAPPMFQPAAVYPT